MQTLFEPGNEPFFHQSHLKGKQDYGDQAVALMLFCNGIVLNYALVLYNKYYINSYLVTFLSHFFCLYLHKQIGSLMISSDKRITYTTTTGHLNTNAASQPIRMEPPHMEAISRIMPKRVSPPARNTPTTRSVLSA